MGKKKARKVEQTEEVPPDPRLLAMKSIISNEKYSRAEEQNIVKKALLPLKRVNSNPLIYEDIPIAKSLFPDSKSVDFGFEGVVDVPNQVFYKEEMPDDVFDTSDIPFPDDLSTSLSFMDSKDLDRHEIEKLDKVKSDNAMHFLNTRVGKDNMKTLLDNVKSPFLDLPKRKDSDTEEDNKNKISIEFDGLTPTIANADRCRQIYIFIVLSLSILIAGTLVGLVYAGVRIPILTELLLPLLSVPQHSTTAIPTVGSITPTISNVTQDSIISIATVGNLSSFILNITQGNTTSTPTVGSLMPSISNFTQKNTTSIFSTTQTTTTTVTVTTTVTTTVTEITTVAKTSTVTETSTVISTKEGSGGGGLDVIDKIPLEGEDVMHLIHAEIYKINGSYVDATWEYHWPPKDPKRRQMLRDMFADVYEYLGFRLEAVLIDDIIPKRISTWRIQARLFAHVEYNLGVMKWYGFGGESSMQHYSRYITRIAKYAKRIFQIRHKSSVQYYWSHFGSTFMDKLRKYEDEIKVERPPAHIPSKWSNCYLSDCYNY